MPRLPITGAFAPYLFVLLCSILCTDIDAQPTLMVDGAEVIGEQGDNVCVEFTVENFTNVTAFIFSLNFNSNILEFDAAIVNSGLPDFTSSSFINPDLNNPDIVRLLWLSPSISSENLPDGTVLFELCFNVVGDPGQCSPIFVNTTGLTAVEVEFLDPAGNVIPTEFGPGEVCVEATPAPFPEVFENSVCSASPGVSDGAISFFIFNGTAPYNVTDQFGATFSVDQAGDLLEINGLASGTYNYTVSDANGSTMTSITVTEGNIINIVPTIREPSCPNDDNGRISLDVTGGTPYNTNGTDDYFFEWSNTQIGIGQDNVRNLTNGTYQVTVSDANGCRTTTDFTLNTVPISSVAVATDPLCEGRNNGRIDISSTGGSGTYEFRLSGPENRFQNGSSTVSFNNLPPGDYIIIVEDEDGGISCPDSSFITLELRNNLTIDFMTNSIDCEANLLDLSLEFINEDGNDAAPYDLRIIDLNTAQVFLDTILINQQSTLPNIPISNYEFLGRSSVGCEIDTFIDLQNSGVLSLDSIRPILPCVGGSNGTLELFVSSASVISYLWDNGSTESQISGINAADYTVTVSNLDGCEIIRTITLDEVDIQIFSSSNAELSCTDDVGDITALANGGNGPYTYEWDHPNNNSSSTLSNITPGLYFVTVTDNNGCSAEQGLRLNAQDALTIDTLRIQSPTCFNLTNGFAEVRAQGGTTGSGPYTFHWSSGLITTSAVGSVDPNLAAGSNWVYAEDGTCASDTLFFDLNEGVRYEVDTQLSTIMPPSCSGESDGFLRIEVSPNLGNTAFTFDFPDLGISNTTNPVLSNLSEGDIRVVITDSNGCSNEETISLEASGALSAEIDSIASIVPVCADDDAATLVVDALGGTGQLMYSWSNNVSNTETASNLPPGTYSVTVTDENGCSTDIADIQISIPPAIEATVTPLEPRCFGEPGGFIVSNVSGGSGMNYRFQANTGQAIDIMDTVVVNPGTYVVRVFDSEGCNFESESILIPQAPELIVDLDLDRSIELGSSTDIDARVVTSTNITDVVWSPLDDLEFNTNDNLDVTVSPAIDRTYSITITDENGCTATDDVNIRVERSVSLYVPNVFNVEETSQNKRLKVFAGSAIAIIDYIRIYDRWGSMLQEVNNVPPNILGVEVWDGTVDGQDLNSGVFVYVLGYTLVDGSSDVLTGDVTLLR